MALAACTICLNVSSNLLIHRIMLPERDRNVCLDLLITKVLQTIVPKSEKIFMTAKIVL